MFPRDSLAPRNEQAVFRSNFSLAASKFIPSVLRSSSHKTTSSLVTSMSTGRKPESFIQFEAISCSGGQHLSEPTSESDCGPTRALTHTATRKGLSSSTCLPHAQVPVRQLHEGSHQAVRQRLVRAGEAGLSQGPAERE